MHPMSALNRLILCFVVLLVRHCLSGCAAEDYALTIDKKCGTAYTITMTYDNMERELSMYIPTIFCNEDEFTKYVNKKLGYKDNTFDIETHQMTIPMLVAIHCLGCSAKHQISKWQSYAEDHTFILIAPEGIQNSFNADQCCGTALQNNINDIGFVQAIINGAQTSFSEIFPFATVRNENCDGYVWITGFSNGGFMTDKIAWMATTNKFSKIVAAAPMAGYIYDNSKYIKNSLENGDKRHKVAMYFHHSKTDTFVNPDGCCMHSTQGCCCGIAQNSLKCLSIYSEFANWLSWNNCNDDVSYENIKSDKMIHVDGDKHVEVVCGYATPEEHGCDTYTSLCLYDNIHHTEWSVYVPQQAQVMIFFLKALCLQQNGKFNEVMVRCECADDSVFDGFHCISPKTALGITVGAVNNGETESNEGIKPNKALSDLGTADNKYSDKQFYTWIFWICGSMVFASIGLYAIVIYKNKQTGYRYFRVNLQDDLS